MHVASVRFLTPDGVAHDLFAGDVIGRVWHAALQVLDPRISEFHACVSLRGGELVLLPLRGSIRLGGVAVKTLRLEAGLDVELAPGFALRVASLRLPDALPALTIDDGDPVRLEISSDTPPAMARRLLLESGLGEQDVYRVSGPVNLVRLMQTVRDDRPVVVSE